MAGEKGSSSSRLERTLDVLEETRVSLGFLSCLMLSVRTAGWPWESLNVPIMCTCQPKLLKQTIYFRWLCPALVGLVSLWIKVIKDIKAVSPRYWERVKWRLRKVKNFFEIWCHFGKPWAICALWSSCGLRQVFYCVNLFVTLKRSRNSLS